MSEEVKIPAGSPALATLLTGAEVYTCPFCAEAIALNTDAQMVLHAEPQCTQFGVLMGTVDSFQAAVVALERVKAAQAAGAETICLVSGGYWRMPGGVVGSCKHCRAGMSIKEADGLISHAQPVCQTFRVKAREARTIEQSIAFNFSADGGPRDN